MMRADAIPAGYTIADRFVVEKALGFGHRSAVYRAVDRRTETRVALKIRDRDAACDPVASERFKREAQILRHLDHPNVVKVYEVLDDGEWSIICMEHFDGSDLQIYRERRGCLHVAELLALARQIVSAMAACHQRGVLHRDLKPQNILVDARGDVKIVDFGIARMGTSSDLTRTGAVLGTPQYLAPETFSSARWDPRSDIYALGLVFYEMLAGMPPYQAASLPEIMTQQLQRTIEPLTAYRSDVPAWLAAVIAKCVRFDAAHRYQTCYELLRDLERGDQCMADAGCEPMRCLSCQAEILPRLPFCQHCGVTRDVPYEIGPYVVALHACDDMPRLLQHLQRAFAISPAAARRLGHRRLPTLLAGGISHDTALALSHQLAVVPADMRIAARPALRLELPLVHAGVAALALVPLFWFAANLSAVARAGLIIAAELVCLGAYRVRTRPILQLRPRPGPDASPISHALLRAMADRVKTLHDRGLQLILATVIRSFLDLGERAADAVLPVDTRAIERAVLLALEVGKTLEVHEAYLARVSVSDIQADLSALAGELGRSVDVDAMEKLMRRQTELRRDVKAYHAIQDLHCRSYLAILNLQAALQRMVDELERARRAEGTREAESLVQLANVARELQDVLEADRTPLSSAPGGSPSAHVAVAGRAEELEQSREGDTW